MATNPDEDEAEDEEEENVRKPTSSEIFFTPEEREFRRQYRHNKSECCLKQAWKRYNNFADIPTIDEVKEDEEGEGEEKFKKSEKSDISLKPEELKKMGVLYDPTADNRRRYLARKYKYLKDTLNLVKEAYEKPYMRPTKPRLIDVPGKHKSQPQVVKMVQDEVIKTDIVPPETALAIPAYTKRWLNISNLNFEVVRETLEQKTQTSANKLLKSEKVEHSGLPKGKQKAARKKKKEIISRLRHPIFFVRMLLQDGWDEKFDIENIPIDQDGNPIGKRTGFCEWCGKDILPIPTLHILRNVWDRTSLYCCKKYQQMVEEAAALEAFLLRERKILKCLIDVRAHHHYPEESEGRTSRDATKSESLDDEKQAKKRPPRSPEPPRPCKPIRDLVDRRRLSYEAELRQRRKDKAVDTFDLPWDPYESRSLSTNPFGDDMFDDPKFHDYYHPEVVMQESEIFHNLSDNVILPTSSESDSIVKD